MAVFHQADKLGKRLFINLIGTERQPQCTEKSCPEQKSKNYPSGHHVFKCSEKCWNQYGVPTVEIKSSISS